MRGTKTKGKLGKLYYLANPKVEKKTPEEIDPLSSTFTRFPKRVCFLLTDVCKEADSSKVARFLWLNSKVPESGCFGQKCFQVSDYSLDQEENWGEFVFLWIDLWKIPIFSFEKLDKIKM